MPVTSLRLLLQYRLCVAEDAILFINRFLGFGHEDGSDGLEDDLLSVRKC